MAVFGSRARGTAGPESDLDLLVEWSGPASLLDYAGLRAELEERTGLRVQLANRRLLKPASALAILREAVADVVPESVRTRSKMGFPVPFGQWLRTGGWGEVVREVLMDRRTRERDLIRPEAAEAIVKAAGEGAPGAADAVWSLLNLELWHRTFIDGDGVQTLPAPRSSPRVPRAAAAAAVEEQGA